MISKILPFFAENCEVMNLVTSNTMQALLSLKRRFIKNSSTLQQSALWIVKSLAHPCPADVRPTVAYSGCEPPQQTPSLNILFGTKVCIIFCLLTVGKKDMASLF